MNISKFVGLPHTFMYGDDEIKLTLNSNFTSRAYKEFTAGLKTAVEVEDVQSLSEMASFLVKTWNLEDNDGDIPLSASEVYSRVPFMLLQQVLTEAQQAISNGGLTKKN